MEPEVIYENKDLLVLNKPSGLLVHPTNKREKDTLIYWILENYPEAKGVGEYKDRPGIVHRLDKETSGLMVVARNNETFFVLKKLFRDKKIIKKYYALVWGKPKINKGRVEKSIRGYKGKRQTVEVYSKESTAKERPSVTNWEVVESFICPPSVESSGSGRREDYALLNVIPETGRMHQIRVHLASIGHPIVCDRLYGGKKKCPSEFGRLVLHAYFLRIPLTESNVLEFEIELPNEFKKTLDTLQQ